jgi:hypothetical protein
MVLAAVAPSPGLLDLNEVLLLEQQHPEQNNFVHATGNLFVFDGTEDSSLDLQYMSPYVG